MITTARATLDRAMTEEEFMRQVIQLAGVRGWHAYHTGDSRGSAEGFPDLSLVRIAPDGTARLVFLECKTMKGRASVAQYQWIDALDAVPGVVARIVRPSDWTWIEDVLR